MKALLGNAPVALSEDVIEAARKNKILLELLERAGGGALLAKERRRLSVVVGVVEEVEKALKGLNHVFIKLVKPVRYVPADVDVLTDRPKAAARLLVAAGYRLVVEEPYTLTLRKRGVNVDLYLHPSKANVVFMRAERLMREAEPASFHGVEVTALSRPAEASLAAAHAVYKDGEVTLNDALTVAMWGRGAAETCAELRCAAALSTVLFIAREILTKGMPAPYPLPRPLWPLRTLWKALADPELAPSLLQLPRRLKDPRLAQLLR